MERKEPNQKETEDQRNSEGTNEEENKKSSTKGDSKKTFKTAWVRETAKRVSMNSHLLLL